MELKRQTFVFLEFSSVRNFYYNNVEMTAANDYIVEVCAVKIAGGEIKKTFHAYVAIENYNANYIKFGDFNPQSRGVTAEHLIGAPSFEEVVRQLHPFVQGCILLLRNSYEITYESSLFNLFKAKAESFGYLFNGAVMNIKDIQLARDFKEFCIDNSIDLNTASPLGLAQALMQDYAKWTEIFEEYDIYFDPDEDKYPRDRDDILSWSLAFAKLFIALCKGDGEA